MREPAEEVIVGPGSFDAFVQPHLEVMFRVARSLTRHRADAEDLVQDTLLRAYRAYATFDGRFPRAWLLTIMRNAEANRHRRRRPGLLSGDDVATEIDRRVPPAPSAEDASADAGVAWLADALAHLTPKLRQVVQLVDVDGLTYEEAAAALDLPPGTVMSRLHRARRRLRERLERTIDDRSER